MISITKTGVLRVYDSEKMLVETFGKNSVRVRITKLDEFTNDNWALMPQEEIIPQVEFTYSKKQEEEQKVNSEEKIETDGAVLVNGKIKVIINNAGKLVIKNNQDKVLLAEYESNRHTSLGIQSRQLKGLFGGNFSASLKFDSDPDEKIYGMGQYQNGIFNLKGTMLEMAQRNSQASVPFMYSSLNYGFLWNNPSVGRVSFGTNITEWEASSTKQIDFWITAGDNPSEIIETYMSVTGKPPVMPEHGIGFWQSKLRYQTQDELLKVAREYKKRGIPLDVIVADFFHWTLEGTWAFDTEYWPDPAAIVKELTEMGTKLMVSIWPTVSIYSPYYQEMKDKGYLVRSENGVKINMLMIDPTSFVDVTNPDARNYMWQKVKDNYVKYGITDFWLDVAEPEYSSYDFENYRYHIGSCSEVGNVYPVMYTKTFYEGLEQEGVNAINLVRCAWAGSQKYGALVWSGDIPSTFESLRTQIVCGLQMAIAGIPWWTTDIGGFHDGVVDDPDFQELLIRWFQYETFCPVMRLHGNRLPLKEPMSNVGGGRCGSGADNEIWSFGEENYHIMRHFIEIRNRLKPYIRKLMDDSHEKGTPIIRPLFYEFPNDTEVWDIKDEYMFGGDILVAPVVELGMRKRNVYLPNGTLWIDVNNGKMYDGGQSVECLAPIDMIPLFVRESRDKLIECLV